MTPVPLRLASAPPQIGWVRRTGTRAAALVLVALCLLLGWRFGLGLHGALGNDAPIWGLTAEGLLHGAAPAVPPAWPLCLALLRRLGIPLVAGGSTLSLALGTCLPVATSLAARALGASQRASLGAALLVLVCPDFIAWSAEFQSNSMAALGLLLVTAAWARVLQRSARWQPDFVCVGTLGLGAAVLTGLLPLVRESEIPLAVAVLVFAPLGLRGGWRVSLLVLLSWWLGPLLAGQAPGVHPMDTSWSFRSGMALTDLGTGTGQLPNYVGGVPRADRATYIDSLRRGDLVALAWFHARRSLSIARDGWAIAAAATVVIIATFRRRPAIVAGILPLCTIAPALLIWSQRRHVLFAVPALLAVASIGCSQPSRTSALARRTLPLVTGILAILALSCWPRHLVAVGKAQQGDTWRADSLAELGGWICQQDPLLIGGPVQDVGLYCPRPRHDPDGSGADWHTLLVGPARMARSLAPSGWDVVGPRVADLAVYQLHPGQPRPCPEARLPGGVPYLSATVKPIALLGCKSAIQPDVP